MDKSERIQAITQDLANGSRDAKRAYSDLEWTARYFSGRYRATKDEVWEAYFAAVNILKSEGVPKSRVKRKPLSNLSKKERQWMRSEAKKIAKAMQDCLGVPVTVHRSPIRTRDDGDSCLHLEIIIIPPSGRTYASLYLSDIRKLNQMDECERRVTIARVAERFKPRDQRVKENIEVIRADLEELMGK